MEQSERLCGRQSEIPRNIQEDFREFTERDISNRNGVALRTRILPERLACIRAGKDGVSREYYVHTPYFDTMRVSIYIDIVLF